MYKCYSLGCVYDSTTMSTTNPPDYAPSWALQLPSPSYTPSPQTHELRLALNGWLRPNVTSCEFVKQTKNGCASVRLSGQDGRASLPVYGQGTSIQGIVDVYKNEGIVSIEVQIDGILKLEQVAGAGTCAYNLCSCKNILWIKDRVHDVPCPRSLPFSLVLPTTFSTGDKTYPLPPSYEAHLSGLPGFRAFVSYTLTVVVVKPNDVPNIVKSALLRKDDWVIFTPFLYHPRSCPLQPVPPPLLTNPQYGFIASPQWKASVSIVPANHGGQDVTVELYLPSTRIFCVRQTIPFHLSFRSSPDALALFMPLVPGVGSSLPKRQFTRIQLMRQTTVDVRNAVVLGTKTDIWRVDCIGEGAFKHTGSGSDWLAYSGEIFMASHITVGGFRAGGFSVRVRFDSFA
ncbi:hypothetical protein V8B97DRAFT_1988871 [Scleroderma yunnanense]